MKPIPKLSETRKTISDNKCVEAYFESINELPSPNKL
jgi:hypothetical protein